MAGERGQATIEWIGAVLAVALGLGVLVAAIPRVDGRSFGGWLAHRLSCAVRSNACEREDDVLRAAYGTEGAQLVRRYAPGIAYEPGTLTLPVDWRECRTHRCSDARDDRDLDVHRGLRGGARATAFTHLVRRGREMWIQYWFYYPDSTTTLAGAAGALNAVEGALGIDNPLRHLDDWESFQVWIDGRGRAWSRSSSHHGYQGCKHAQCANRWIPWTGWTRVSRGSHAGHVPTRADGDGAVDWPPLRDHTRDVPAYPGLDVRERTTTSAGLRLVPLETIDRGAYTPLDSRIAPPWRKQVYADPRSDSTS